jgi:hypothetical protein
VSVIRSIRLPLIGAMSVMMIFLGGRWTRRHRGKSWPTRAEFDEMDTGTLNSFLESINTDVRVRDRERQEPAGAPLD